MKDEYDLMAPFYDACLGPFLAPVRRAVCRAAVQWECETVLDICCGTGAQCMALERLGIGVAGVDRSAAMLSVARRKSPRTIPYFRSDAAGLPFKDALFDGAVLSFALHEKDRATRMRILEEARRVLVPGGKILMVDFVTPEGFRAHVSHGFARLVERAAGGRHYAHFQEYMQKGALAGCLAASRVLPLDESRFHMGATGLIVASHACR